MTGRFLSGKDLERGNHLQRGENGRQVPCQISGLVKLDPKVQAEDTRDARAEQHTQHPYHE